MKGKPQRVIETHRRFYWPTSDDWSPNFIRNTVLVRVHTQVTGDNAFARISVWGADDTGMERDLYCHTRELPERLGELTRFADNLPNPLTKAWLSERGFVWA